MLTQGRSADEGGYVVASYRAPDDAAWYHFLHGNVPGHQIDFIYRPEVPQGSLTRQHFSHLSRLMKYIEPQTNGLFAFAIGNLSRDDTQYEPGHGGVALIFGLRIRGVTDHAGRQDPPFAHGIAAIDRALDYATLLTSAETFHRHVLGAGESEAWYRAYVRCALQDPAGVPGVIATYVHGFGDLPLPAASTWSTAWVTGGAVQPRRIVIAHEDDAPFPAIASAAARIAAVLYRSDIRWTVISNGREDDVPNGVSIRFLARSDLSAADAAGTLHDLAALPAHEAGIAELLFGATPIATGEKPATAGWRQRYSMAEEPSHEAAAQRPSWEGHAHPSTVVAPLPNPRRPPSERPAPAAAAEPPNDAVATAPLASIKPPSEPPEVASGTILEGPIRAAAPTPEVAAPAPAPPPTSVVVAKPDFRGSTRRFWWVVGGFCAAAILILVYLALSGHDVAAPESPGSRASPASSAGPAASFEPPALPVPTGTPPPAQAPAPPSATAPAPKSNEPARKPESPRRPPTAPRRQPPAPPTSSPFDRPLTQ